MTLTSRVSRFFLIALAAILVGYSAILYGLARYSLYREFDQQLQGTLNTLVAAIEVENDDVKWEPSDHTVTVGSESDSDDARWAVVDETMQIVDTSPNLNRTPDKDEILKYARLEIAPSSRFRDWRFLQARLSAPAPKPVKERDVREHAALLVTVARSTAPLHRTLNGLAALVILISVGTWSVAAVGGRWFCRQALEPVSSMAAACRMIGTESPRQRLPISPSRDELRDLAIAFNSLLDQLFQAYQHQQQFAANAAHQLRTPLTVLQGQIEVTCRRERTPAEYARTMNLLNDQVAELRQIVESLLFLARSEDQSEAPPTSPVDLSEWLPTYLRKWASDPRFPDISLQISVRRTCPISPPLLEQLMDNLLSNALKYSSPGSPVTISLAQGQNGVRLEVRDCGMGIAAQDTELIFEPFFRSEAARRSGIAGTGLGLALAARIARALQGHLTCHSQLNSGSQFTLEIPAVDPLDE